MRFLDTQLADRHRIAYFPAYIEQLDPLAISLSIYTDSTGQSMLPLQQAWEAWKQLAGKLSRLADQHKPVFARLLEMWSGPAAEEMKEAITRYEQQLGAIVLYASDMKTATGLALGYFQEARFGGVLPPSVIIAIRQRIADAVPNPESAELEAARQKNITEMLNYYEKAHKVMDGLKDMTSVIAKRLRVVPPR